MARNLLHSRCEELGSAYSIATVDHERCIYRKLNESFDIEISGVDNAKTQRLRINVYVWRTHPHREIVEKIFDIPTIHELRQQLQLIEDKYPG